MEAELKLLNKCPEDKLEKFLYCVVEDLCGQRPPLFCDYSEIWSLTEWWDVNNSLKKFFSSSAKYIENKEKIQQTLSHLLPEYREKVLNCLNICQNDIEKALVEKTNSICDNYLKDFDWKLKLILSSDSLYNIREPCLELDLTLVSDDEKKQLCVEMSKEELKNFIDTLEAAHKVVVQMMV
ncbi:COMM domain-containing protein 8-like [Centruroides vittatus]|uniref:COMM domain-containing protein 8-like n=1 Tax=Centruroides vittatus TaxID=120091 RepID=UPI00350F6D01